MGRGIPQGQENKISWLPTSFVMNRTQLKFKKSLIFEGASNYFTSSEIAAKVYHLLFYKGLRLYQWVQNGVKTPFLDIYYHYSWRDLICLACFFFPTLWAKDLLKEFIYWLFSSIPIVLLSSIICIMKRVTIFKKHLLVTASVSDCDQEF